MGMSGIFITGGTGYLGRELVRQLLAQDSRQRIVVFSRSESRQAEMKRQYPEGGPLGLRYRIGDIRDIDRLRMAMRDCGICIHTAALKRIECCEQEPYDAIATNVIGSQNVLRVCQELAYHRCIVISTDKAVQPAPLLYGATKLCMERMAVSYNNMGTCRISVVRYANVRGSTGSCLSLWESQVKAGQPLTITHPDMTRLWIDIGDAARFVLDRLQDMEGGEIFVPRCQARGILDMALSLAPHREYPITVTGLRADEKMHETLISEMEAERTYAQPGDWYTIYPSLHDWRAQFERRGGKVPPGWRYGSDASCNRVR